MMNSQGMNTHPEAAAMPPAPRTLPEGTVGAAHNLHLRCRRAAAHGARPRHGCLPSLYYTIFVVTCWFLVMSQSFAPFDSSDLVSITSLHDHDFDVSSLHFETRQFLCVWTLLQALMRVHLLNYLQQIHHTGRMDFGFIFFLASEKNNIYLLPGLRFRALFLKTYYNKFRYDTKKFLYNI